MATTTDTDAVTVDRGVGRDVAAAGSAAGAGAAPQETTVVTTRTTTPSIAAAGWPIILAASIALVCVVAATPFVVYWLVSEVAPARTATWVTVVAGLVMVVVLAIAWVQLRRRREVSATGRID